MNNQTSNDSNPGFSFMNDNNNHDDSASNNNSLLNSVSNENVNNSNNLMNNNQDVSNTNELLNNDAKGSKPVNEGESLNASSGATPIKTSKNNLFGKVSSGASTSGSINKKVMPQQASKNPKYTENWINIKAIKGGIIYNDKNEMVTGVKIRPKNIFILEQSEMDNTLIGLMNFYNTIDYEFWIIVCDRPVDIAMYEAELQVLFSKTSDQMARKVIGQDMDKGDYFKNNNVVDTEYYLLFKHKDLNTVQKRVRDIINGLAGAGLVASQTSNDDMRMIIDNFLNGGRKFEGGTVILE